MMLKMPFMMDRLVEVKKLFLSQQVIKIIAVQLVKTPLSQFRNLKTLVMKLFYLIKIAIIVFLLIVYLLLRMASLI